MKTSLYTFFEQTIIDNINLDDYEITKDNCLYDKIKALYNIFKREYVHQNNKHLDVIFLFAQWLQGLPSTLSVPFCNNEILENALLSGCDVSTEYRENLFLNEYWNNLARAFFTLKENL